MATVDEILVRIRADTKQLENAMRKSTGEVKKLEKQTKQTGSAFSSFGSLLPTIGVAALSKNLLQAASSMQSLNARLKAATGSTQAAAEAMDFLKEASARQNINLLDMADGYTRLLPAVKAGTTDLQGMRRMLGLVNDNLAAFGISGSEARLTFMGLSQTLTSGTVTMEDMRQVTDRMPGLFDRVAKSLGTTSGGLRTAISTGKVLAEDILPGLELALLENEGTAEEMATTFASATVAMENAFLDLGDALSNTGAIDFFASRMNDLANTARLAGAAMLIVGSGWASVAGQNEAANRMAQEAIDLYDKTEKAFDDFQKILKDKANPVLEEHIKLWEKYTKKQELREEIDKNRDKWNSVLGKGTEENSATLSDFIKELEKQVEIGGLANNQQEVAIAMHKAEQAALKDKTKLTEEQRKKIKQLVETLQEQEKATKAAEDAAQDMARAMEQAAESALEPWNNAFDSIQSELVNMVSEFDFSFKSIANIMKRAAAEAAVASFLSPIQAGITGGGVGSQSGSLGLNLSSLGGLSSFGQPSSFVTGSIFENTPLSFGQSIGASSALSSAFSGFGIGGLAAGLTGGNGTTGALGGALGGIAGNALLPGIGGAIGSALGGALGGLVGGGEPPTSASQFLTQTATGSGFSGTSFGSKTINDSIARSISGQLLGFLDSVEAASGIDLAGNTIFGGVNTKQKGGGFLQAGAFETRFNAEDAQATSEAFAELALELLNSSDANQDLINALKDIQIEGRTAEEVLQDIAVASGKAAKDFNKSIEQEILSIVDPTAFALQRLNAEFAILKDQAGVVGGDLAQVARLEQLKIEELKSEEAREQERAMEEARRQAERIRQEMERASDSLNDALSSIFLGSSSGLSIGQKEELALNNFIGAFQAVTGGDVQAVGDLTRSAQDLLDIERSINASSSTFKNIQALVGGALGAATTSLGGDALNIPDVGGFNFSGSSNEQIVQLLQALLSATQQTNNTLSQTNLPTDYTNVGR